MRPAAKARLIVCVVAAASLGSGLAGCSGDDSTNSPNLSDGGTEDATKDDEPPIDSAPVEDSAAPVEEENRMSNNSDADANAQADTNAYGLDGDSSSDSNSDSNADSAAEATVSEAGSDSGSDAASAADGDAQSALGSLGDGGEAGDNEGGDAGIEAGPDAGIDTLGIILATQGNLCAACAATACLNAADAGASCEGFANSVAGGGAAAGESKTQLCYATLSCILNSTTACYDLGSGADECYCGLTAVPECKASGPGSDAPCASQEEMGLETTAPATVFDRLYDPTFGAGRANALLICLGNNCGDCLP